MKLQIRENGGKTSSVDGMLDEADAQMALLAADRAAVAARRRALIEPAYKTVVAQPTEVHNKIALGGVLVAIGLSAVDADALAGLLALHADEVIENLDGLVDADPLVRFGTVLIRHIDRQERDLTARGLFETWSRRLAAYREDRAEWLARDEKFRLDGAWRHEPMTRGQRWLIRVTCRLRRIDLPGHLARGDAADWIEENGGNLNYSAFVS